MRFRRWSPTVLVFSPAIFAVAACGTPAPTEPIGETAQASVCATGAVVKGVDVSVYQGTIDWTSVKGGGVDFAIARISDGSSLDSNFASNWTGMKSAGLVRGAYQYFEPGDDPTTQAQIVVSAVGMLGSGDLPVTADMEVSGGQGASTIVANLQTWAAAVKAGTGKEPMIYTALGFWNASVSSSAFASNPLWVANWQVTCPSLPTGWSNWAFWQDADNGTVAGISGNVDTDEFNGSLTQLQAFAGGASSTSDAGPPAAYYAATYVSQSWPLASMAWPLTPCQTVPSTITLKNTGTSTWDSHTRLATTQPRDRASVFADSTWVSTSRAAQVTGTVAPGQTFDFKFDFHAPPTPGTYTEYFGLVEDGSVWFSDPGQGGPADTDIEANIQVMGAAGSCQADPNVPDAGPDAEPDAGTTTDAGGTTPGDAGPASGADAGQAGSGDSGGATTGTGTGAGVGTTAGDGGHLVVSDAGGVAHGGGGDASASGNVALPPTGSSGCSVGDRRGGPPGATWALGGVAILVARRRRRTATSRSSA